MTWPIVEFEAFGGVDVVVRECPETGRQRREVRANGWGEYLPAPPREVFEMAYAQAVDVLGEWAPVWREVLGLVDPADVRDLVEAR